MIQIDRTSNVPVHAQLVNKLKFQIADGQYRTGDLLPATRKLADQLDISFHTVRKAYATLQEHGLVEVRTGRGYEVVGSSPLSKTERLEQGAEIVGDMLQRLIGIGLDDEEINYLIEEQRSLIDAGTEIYKIVVAGPYREWSQLVAEQVSAATQQDCTPVVLDELGQHADADIVLVPYAQVKRVLTRIRTADLVGVQYELDDEALSAVARLLDHETLAIVTRYSDAIAPLSNEFRTETKFSGQIMAVSVQDGANHIPPLIRQSDVLLYTPGAARRIRPFLERIERHGQLNLTISASTLDRIRSLVPA